MSVPSSDTYNFDSSICGYHVYRERLVVAVEKTLICRKEQGNIHDVYTVAVVEDDVIVGHVPRAISAVCYLFIKKGGTISCEITGSHRYSSDLPQGVLELPCKLTFSGPVKVLVPCLLDITAYIYLPQGGRETPSTLRFTGTDKEIATVLKLLSKLESDNNPPCHCIHN